VTDEDLIDRARRGEMAAFGELVDRHRSGVVRAARAALGGPDEAEDAAQDAFVAAWRGLDGFRGDAAVRTWLLAIAWRTALSRRRSLRRWTERWRSGEGSNSAALDEVAADDPSPERTVIDAEFRQAVRRVVSSLSPRLRDPLLLAASGACTMEEIATMLGTPVGTVKWRVSEARRLVREKTARMMGNDRP
jgi:RNA polymerase sigma-70 factor (ECF subfamily)